MMIPGIVAARRRIDVDAAGYFVRAGITSLTQQMAVNTLTIGLKDASLWTKLHAIYPFVGGTAAAHSHNLKSSSYQITWNGTLTHDANGVTSNGTTGYGDTGYNPLSVAADLSDAHISMYCRTASTACDPIGCWDGGSRIFAIEGVVGGGPVAYNLDCNHLADGRMSGTLDGLAHTLITRRSTSDAEGYNRGVTVGTKTGAVVGCLSPNQNIFVCARNDAGAPNWYYQGTMALSSMGASMTDTDAANFYTLVQAFQTSLGRHV